MARQKSIKTLKKQASSLFQLYVRLRDSNENGFGSCCSCGKWVHYKEANGGHFITRGKLSTMLHPQNVHLECAGCNMYGGNASGYALFMLEKYGQETIEELHILKDVPTKITAYDYEKFIEKYTYITNQMKTSKGEL